MYAYINFNGNQIKVVEGENVKVPYLNKKVGSKIDISNVLFYDDGKKKHIGSPYVKSLSFIAKIISHNKENKIKVYKKKRRKGYDKMMGHKQQYSIIKIDNLSNKKPTKKKTIVKKNTTAKKNTKATKK